MHEVFTQMRNVFEEDNFVPQRDMIKQDQVLMQLAHIANVGNDRHPKLPAQQTHGNEFTHARHTHRVHLNETRATRLQIILKHNAIRDVFAKGEPGRCDGIGERFVP